MNLEIARKLAMNKGTNILATSASDLFDEGHRKWFHSCPTAFVHPCTKAGQIIQDGSLLSRIFFAELLFMISHILVLNLC